MRGRKRGVVFAGLAGVLALGLGGCRIEHSTYGQYAQPVDYPVGGAGAAGQPMDDEQYRPPDQADHGQGLGNVIDAHGYERTKQDGITPGAGPGPVHVVPERGGGGH